MRNLTLIGAGGMASEIVSWLDKDLIAYVDYLYDDLTTKKAIGRFPISAIFKKENYHLIAVGYPETKVQIVRNIIDSIFPSNIKWAKPFIHPRAVLGKQVDIGDGSIIYPNVTLTTNIEIGMISTLNSMVNVSHDCIIGEMFHAAPGAKVSGNVEIGNRVFLGANSCIKEYLYICDDVIIGAGAVVVKDIIEPGTYAGNPARKL